MFAVKSRRAVLEPEVVRELVRISQEIGERYEIEDGVAPGGILYSRS